MSKNAAEFNPLAYHLFADILELESWPGKNPGKPRLKSGSLTVLKITVPLAFSRNYLLLKRNVSDTCIRVRNQLFPF